MSTPTPTSPHAPSPSRAGRPVAALALAAMFAHNAWLSWLKWGDMLVDAGKELDQPAAILHGKLLYRDLVGVYGPFPTYLNALLYALFGVHADVLRGAGLATAALMCMLLYRLARRFMTRPPSVGVAGTFLYVCAFAQLTLNGNYNFVLPYTYAATYGITAVAASLFFLVRHVQEGRAVHFRLSVACLVVAALCKLEVLFAAGITHAVFAAELLWQRRLRPRTHGIPYALAAVVVLAVHGFFWSQASSLTASYLSILAKRAEVTFNLDKMGLGNVGDSLKALGTSLLILGVPLGAVAPLVRVVQRHAPGGGAAGALALLAFLLSAALVRWALLLPVVATTVSLRMLPVVLLAAGTGLGWQWWKDPAARPAVLPASLVLATGLACLPRICLQTWAAHFGFYLVPLALLALGVTWFVLAPRWLGLAPAAQRVLGAAGLGVFAGLALQHLAVSQQLYAGKTVPIVGPRGTTHGFAQSPWMPYPEGRAYAEAVRVLARFPAQTRMLAVPEGVALLYFSGHDNPYPADEWLGAISDQEQLALWRSAPPDVVVLVDYHRTERSAPRFGVDYAQESARWIEQSYRPTFVAPERFIVVLVRNDQAG